PRRAKPTGEANDFIGELLEFTGDYINRANAWREKAQLDAEDRTEVMGRIHQCANELSTLAQSFLTDATPPTRARKRTGGAVRALCLIVALVALVLQARAQPLPPDQACSEIVKTLDRITGHRDSNQEAVRRGFIACRLFPTRSSPPSGNVMDEIEPNPRG